MSVSVTLPVVIAEEGTADAFRKLKYCVGPGVKVRDVRAMLKCAKQVLTTVKLKKEDNAEVKAQSRHRVEEDVDMSSESVLLFDDSDAMS